MFTDITYQDWEATPESGRLELLEKIIRQYKSSEDFQTGLEANRYDRSNNTAIAQKYVLKPTTITVNTEIEGVTQKIPTTQKVEGNRLRSSFLRRFTLQESQFLLGNGVTLRNANDKKRLGFGFDTALAQMGRRALLHGVCWGYWNLDHIEVLEAVRDGLSGFVAVLDEMTGAPMLGVQFWQISTEKPLYVRLFEREGVTLYRRTKDDKTLVEQEARRGYRLTTVSDAAGVVFAQTDNYGVLPIIPFYGNEDRASELTPSIKTKIDAYDRILSDFGDNLDRANDVYWVLNNFGGSTAQIAEMLEQINTLKAVLNQSDGTGAGSTAEPHTIEVPYAARQAALELLRHALYEDYMALDTSEFTGSSLTNVGIEAATINLNLKADGLEWGAFAFVQGVLKLIGTETEEIAFKRREIVNKSEIVQDIILVSEYLDDETILKKIPYIEQEEIPQILENVNARRMTGYSNADAADSAARRVKNDEQDDIES